jgi:hypothetical protein
VTALVCAAYYERTGTVAAMCAAAVSLAYAVQFRPESLLVLPVVGVLAWPRLSVDLRTPAGWWVTNLFLLLVAVHVAHLYVIRDVDWGTVGPRLSLRYLPENLRVNGGFYLHDERFPVAFTLLAAAGLFAPGYARERVSMAACFLVFLGIGLVFYAGSYNYGADVRYSLMTYPPIAVLGGLGAARLGRAVSRLSTQIGAGSVGVPLVVVALLFQFLWYAPVVRATTEEAWAARADVRFAHTFSRAIPGNSYVLTHNPSMFHVWGVNAGQMSLVTSSPAYLRHLAERYQGGIYLHWNFWCNVQDPVQPDICRAALAAAPGEVVTEYRERDQRFAFYRVKLSVP